MVWLCDMSKNKTPELCLAAVQQNGQALKHVKEQTPELCLAAVQQNGLVLKHVKEQTPELCMAAVQQNNKALDYVKNREFEIFIDKVLRYIKDTKDINDTFGWAKQLMYPTIPLHFQYQFIEMMKKYNHKIDCSICREYISEPKILNCGHLFCNVCVSEWLKRINKCPVCCTVQFQ